MAPAGATWGVACAFFGLAGWFLFASPTPQVPRAAVVQVALHPNPTGARREVTGTPPTVAVGGFEHRCVECHRLFNSPPGGDGRTLTQHTDIQMRHGMNSRCFNCHDEKDREQFVLYDGTKVGFDQIPRLCSQCHGTVFRDWQRGTHGKTLGSWDAANPARRRLTCNECHDPHAPAYKPIEPLPGPNTLRMGDQDHSHGHGERHMPLRRWSRDAAAPASEHAPPSKGGHP